jgi:hypothetical protein
MRAISWEHRQARLDQQSGVDEGIADPVAIADELGFELPALWPTWRCARKPRRQGITVDCGV